MIIKKRTFVSFDEYCPYECKHCYTYGITRDRIRNIDEIIDSISSDDFDIIYVSQKNDNFSNPRRGIMLCQALFERYKQNMFAITRNVFSEAELAELVSLKQKMANVSKHFFIAVSINATDSISVSENTAKTCTPKQRVAFIKALSEKGFKPILMLRPIFPDRMIPVDECLQLIDELHPYISCVVTSGLGVNADILSRLGMHESDFVYSNNQEYLDGAITSEIRFIDVDYELQQIHEKCAEVGIPVFLHSMPAINYIAGL